MSGASATGGQAVQGTFVSERELAEAFTEWDRRYREEPERFQSEAEHLLKETPESYGEACAPYLLHILDELRRTRMQGLQP